MSFHAEFFTVSPMMVEFELEIVHKGVEVFPDVAGFLDELFKLFLE